MMEVILLERIEKLGQMGELVNVKPGFARNYLLPQGKALRANKANLARFEDQRSELDAANLERRGEAEKAATKLTGFICILLRQASDSDQLYGSVTARDIAGAALEGGVTITRNQIQLERPIKTLGIHSIKVALHPEVIVSIGVNVARTGEEAETQELASRQPAASADAGGGQEEVALSIEEIFEHPEDIQLDSAEGENGEAAEESAPEEASDSESAEDAENK